MAFTPENGIKLESMGERLERAKAIGPMSEAEKTICKERASFYSEGRKTGKFVGNEVSDWVCGEMEVFFARLRQVK